MSTEIKTGNMPVNINNTTNHKSSKASVLDTTAAQAQSGQVKSTDTVSITEKVSRLQEIENQLADIPVVNDAKVTEIKAAIADGSFSIDPTSIAAKLINMESGN